MCYISYWHLINNNKYIFLHLYSTWLSIMWIQFICMYITCIYLLVIWCNIICVSISYCFRIIIYCASFDWIYLHRRALLAWPRFVACCCRENNPQSCRWLCLACAEFRRLRARAMTAWLHGRPLMYDCTRTGQTARCNHPLIWRPHVSEVRLRDVGVHGGVMFVRHAISCIDVRGATWRRLSSCAFTPLKYDLEQYARGIQHATASWFAPSHAQGL